MDGRLMAVIIDSTRLTSYRLDSEQNLWVYNGLDCNLTHEIAEVLKPQVAANAASTYQYSLGMQAPALAMMRRGFNVDPQAVEMALKGTPEPTIPGYMAKDMTEQERITELARMREGLEALVLRLGGMAKVPAGKNSKKPVNAVVNPKALLQQYAEALGCAPLNYNSPIQLKAMIYGKLGIEPVMTYKKGKGQSVSLDHKTL